MVTLADARRIIAAAEKKAEEIGQPMNIAVVDSGGNLVSHVRMDKAWIGSIAISDPRRIIAAAEKKAEEIGQPMNIAVVDSGGNLVSHVRMDKAWIGSIDI